MSFSSKNLTVGRFSNIANAKKKPNVENDTFSYQRDKYFTGENYAPVFPAWKVLKIGSVADSQLVRSKLLEQGFVISNWADDILSQVVFEKKERVINLVRLSIKELNLRQWATNAEIYSTAQSFGLTLCPPETAPLLWLQYPDLLDLGEWALIASEPIVDSGGSPLIFYLAHIIGGRRLSASNGRSNQWWDIHNHWIFVNDI